LNWVKNGRAENFEENGNLTPLTSAAPPPQISYAPAVLPAGLKFSGIMVLGKVRQAVINGAALEAGAQKVIKLRDKSVLVRCKVVRNDAAIVELNESHQPLTLNRGEEVLIP
jgi:hypothetical protein